MHTSLDFSGHELHHCLRAIQDKELEEIFARETSNDPCNDIVIPKCFFTVWFLHESGEVPVEGFSIFLLSGAEVELCLF